MNSIAATLILLLPYAHFQSGGDETIPQTNRPANFSGAAGLYTVQVRATPTTVRVEDPITLTIKIISQKPGPWKYPPQRDKLKLFPATLETDFFVEPLPEEDRFLAGENAWEFSWRLLPKSEQVAKIPEVEFVYYRAVEPHAFAVAEGAHSIPLTVQPRPATVLAGPNSTRTRLEKIAEGDHLLGQDASDTFLWTMAITGLVLPPLASLTAYLCWHQAFPEAAERLRRRRSRALKTALAQLRRAGPTATPGVIRIILVDYLRAHLHLLPGEPTPAEIRQTLLPGGVPAEKIEQAVALVTACDVARFAPDKETAHPQLLISTSQVLDALEKALCAPQS
jgi:hypothetical protein